MRVAFILAEYPILHETFIRRELEALSAQGHDAMVFALRRGPGTDTDASLRWPVVYRPGALSLDWWRAQFSWCCHRPWAYLVALVQVCLGCLPRPRVLLAALHHFPTAAYFAMVARQSGIQRLHAHFAYVPGIVGNVASRLSGAAFSFTAHAWDIYAEPTMLRENIRRADRVLTCTRYNVATLARLEPGYRGRLHLCYHGLPLHVYRPLGPAQENSRLILCIGRLVEKKGHRHLISACEALKRRGILFECAIVGDGPLRASLERLVRARGLDAQVRFVGRVPNEHVRDWLGRAAVLVCPCVVARDGDRDGLPNVVLEALACRVPVVASRLSGIPEAVQDGVTGLLAEPGDADALADRIEDVFLDPGAARERSARGRERIEHAFCLERNVAEQARVLFAGPVPDVGCGGYERVKRALDVATAGIGLLVAAPAFALIALLVKLDSPGPAFFCHNRIGKGGRRFRVWKFRTMAQATRPYGRTPFDDHDPRLTRFGRFLRNHGLDELPQLVNVLKGDMSLVGPRPEMPYVVEHYTPAERHRLSVMPGITGLWQVDGPHNVPIHEHIEYDLEYIKNRSLSFDLCILARTVPILFGKRRRRRHSQGTADAAAPYSHMRSV